MDGYIRALYLDLLKYKYRFRVVDGYVIWVISTGRSGLSWYNQTWLEEYFI